MRSDVKRERIRKETNPKKLRKHGSEETLEEEHVPSGSQGTRTVDREKIEEELDELLDEIDGLLEENAEEFVKGYVQKGGQ